MTSFRYISIYSIILSMFFGIRGSVPIRKIHRNPQRHLLNMKASGVKRTQQQGYHQKTSIHTSRVSFFKYSQSQVDILESIYQSGSTINYNLIMTTVRRKRDRKKIENDEDYLKFARGPRKPSRRCKSGIWSEEENMAFIMFIKDNIDVFEQERERRGKCAFKMAEKYLKRRSAGQCRSHFQKLQKKYGEIDDIIAHFIERDSNSKSGSQQLKEVKKTGLMNAAESFQLKNHTDNLTWHIVCKELSVRLCIPIQEIEMI